MFQIKSNLILTNGLIYTVDRNRNLAQALAIADDKIVFAGGKAEIEEYVNSNTEVIDLNGKMVLPGFVDAHAHPSQAMDFFGNISLYLLDSLDQYQTAIRKFVENHSDADVYRGSGWSDSLFPNFGPTKEILDEIVPDKPISLVSYDGHSLWVNSITLERARINRETPDPEGGIIERHPESGEPNGTLRETATKLIEGVFPDYSIQERKNALLTYQKMAHRAGITLVHDAMLDDQSIAAYKELEAENSLAMRFRGAITLGPDRVAEEQIDLLVRERSRNTHPRFQTNAAKIFVDGVVEGGTAYLLESYKHKPEFFGDPIWKPDQLRDIVIALDKQNIQIHVHVIGDAAVGITLDALEAAQKINGVRDSRHLLTHLQLIISEDIQRLNRLGVIGVPNPYWFKVDDYYWTLALPYLGKKRANNQYPLRSFIDAGVIMASASDFPVTIPFDPLIGIQMGITRSEIGELTHQVLWSDERVSLEQMITSFTFNGAYANFLEKEVGSLEFGKQADIVVLDQNLFEIPAAEIANTKVLLTFVDGKEVFRAPEFGE